MRKGFTLLEIMVSISILSFGLILILQGFSKSLNAIKISQNNLKSALLADEKMTEFLINIRQDKSHFARSSDGESTLDSLEFNWKLISKPEEGNKDLNKALAYISWREGTRKGKFPLITYIRIPIDEEKEL